MRMTRIAVCLLALLVMVGGAFAQNNILPNPPLSNPDVAYTHSLHNNPYGLGFYDATQHVFSVSGAGVSVNFPPKVGFCNSNCPPAVLTVAIQVDNAGNLTGGNPNGSLPDFELDGQVTNGANTYTSPLLIGKITEFYYDGVNNTPNFRFRFAVTGGSMASLYLNPPSLNNDLWMTLILEDHPGLTNFHGSFATNFGGESKGDIFGTPGKCYGKIGDFVWNDLDGDGIQGSGEPGLDGITVRLYDSGNNVIATDVTHLGPTGSTHGYYQFTGVCAGTYKVQVDETTLPPHFEATTVNASGSTTANDSNPNPSPVTLTTNASVDETIDFGYIAMQGSLGDYVWYDANRNGVQDADEHGINGVKVNLYDSSHTFLATTTTAFGGPNNVDGYYQFTGLDEGNYIVEIDASTLPANYSPTTSFVGDSAHDSNGSPATANLPTDSSSDQTIDFGYVTPCNGKIGDFVWHDLDRDGLQGGSEPGINGVHLILYDSAHNQVGMAITNPNGYYLFDGVCDGTYEVDVDASTLPPTFTPTTAHVGSDTTIDSNGSPAPVTLTLDSNNNVTQDLTIDFGYVSPCNGAIGDFVWLDLNGNGIQDSGEVGINNVTVNLRDAQNHLLNSTTTDGTGYYQFTGLCAATYIVEVIPPTGYAASPTGQTTTDKDSNPNPSTVVLSVIDQNGDVTNDETIDFGFVPGRIIVRKFTDPTGSPQSFTFTPSYNGGATFNLTDGGSNDSGPLTAGQYSVAESVPQNWVQTSASCDNGNTPDAINLAAGQTVTCTFKNTQNGNIIVNKVTVPAGSTQSFSFTTTGAGYNGFSLTGATGSNSNDSGPLAPGLYSVAETALSGWDLTSAVCDNGQSIGAINLAAGHTVTCTFTNTQRAHIIVKKVTVPSGSQQSFSFTTTGSGYNGFSLMDGGSNDSGALVPGSYSVAETAVSGWDLTSATCDNGQTIGSISLQAGQTVTCVFTNTQRAHIIVKKVTVPSGSTQSFSFTTTGTGYNGFSLMDGGSNDSGALAPGTYSVAETAVSGWDLTSATCDNGQTIGAINLQAGQTVTCTFTNTQRGHIIVKKVTVPSGSQQSFAFTTTGTGYNGFSLMDGGSNDSGALAPGTYSVAETTVSGWDLTSATCDNGQTIGSINLAAGKTVTCTFTNTQRAKLIVVKNTIGGDDTFSYVGGGSGVSASFSLTTSGGTASTSFSNLAPGSGYSVSENVPGAWQLLSATCDNGNNPNAITLAAGKTVTCTFTNKKYPPVTATCVSITAIVGIPITPVQMTASGGAGAPYTFSATGLPANIVMDSDGTIHGTANSSGTFNYTVTVKDKNGNIGLVNCSVTVTKQNPPPLTVACPSGTTGTVGTPYNGQVPVTGGTPPYTFSVSAGNLPPGLTLDVNTGAITGTPTTPGTFSFTIKVVDSTGQIAYSQCTSNCTSITSTWDFSSPLGTLGNSQTYTVNGLTVTAYGFTNGGAGTKLYGKQDGGDENGVGIANTSSDHEIDTHNFVQLDLQNVIASGATSAQMKVGSVQSGESYNIYGSNTLGNIGTQLAGPLTADDTYFDVPNYGQYRYVSVRAAYKDVLLEVLSAVLPPGCSIVVSPNPLHVSCPAYTGKVGVYYNSSVVASGGSGSYKFSIVSGSLPPGLTLNSTTGAITGTPTKSGTYTFTTKVTDANNTSQSTTKECKITIGSTKPPTVSCPSTKNGKVGSAFSATVPVTGGTAPFTFSISSGSLPPGLHLDPNTGVISGTPTSTGSYSFTVKVIDAAGNVAYSTCDQCQNVDEKFDFLKECGTFKHSHNYHNDGIDLDVHGFNKDGSWRNLKCRGNGNDDDGVGLSGNYDDGIDANSFVQVDLSNAMSSGATDVVLSVGSIHYGETYNVYGSNRLGEIGSLLLKDVKADGGEVHVPGFPNHKYICVKANRRCVHLKYVTCHNPCQCTITISPKGCTYTQGGWGSKPSGNNPGQILHDNWSKVYGYGNVKVGGWNTATFTSSTAVQNYLPAGGTPNPLWQSYTNPSSAYSVFHGQVLALQLNVDFSNKGITTTGLAGMHVQSGPLTGWTVQQVLNLANQVLGGNNSGMPHGMSISDLNNVVDSINNAFDGGDTDTGYLN